MFRLNSYSTACAFLRISSKEAGEINARKAVDEQNQKVEEKIMLNHTKSKIRAPSSGAGRSEMFRYSRKMSKFYRIRSALIRILI